MNFGEGSSLIRSLSPFCLLKMAKVELLTTMPCPGTKPALDMPAIKALRLQLLMDFRAVDGLLDGVNLEVAAGMRNPRLGAPILAYVVNPVMPTTLVSSLSVRAIFARPVADGAHEKAACYSFSCCSLFACTTGIVPRDHRPGATSQHKRPARCCMTSSRRCGIVGIVHPRSMVCFAAIGQSRPQINASGDVGTSGLPFYDNLY
jgi:hypothetical protein